MDNFEAIQKINKRSYSKEDIKLINEDKSFLIQKTCTSKSNGTIKILSFSLDSRNRNSFTVCAIQIELYI